MTANRVNPLCGSNPDSVRMTGRDFFTNAQQRVSVSSEKMTRSDGKIDRLAVKKVRLRQKDFKAGKQASSFHPVDWCVPH